jgi:hypothetical protein
LIGENLLPHIKNHILEIIKKLSITGRNIVYSGRVEGYLVQEGVHTKTAHPKEKGVSLYQLTP